MEWADTYSQVSNHEQQIMLAEAELAKLKNENEKLNNILDGNKSDIQRMKEAISYMETILEEEEGPQVNETAGADGAARVSEMAENNLLKQLFDKDMKSVKIEYDKKLDEFNMNFEKLRDRYKKNSPSYKILEQKQIENKRLQFQIRYDRAQIDLIKQRQKQFADIQKKQFQATIVKFAENYLAVQKYNDMKENLEELKKKEQELLREYWQSKKSNKVYSVERPATEADINLEKSDECSNSGETDILLKKFNEFFRNKPNVINQAVTNDKKELDKIILSNDVKKSKIDEEIPKIPEEPEKNVPKCSSLKKQELTFEEKFKALQKDNIAPKENRTPLLKNFNTPKTKVRIVSDISLRQATTSKGNNPILKNAENRKLADNTGARKKNVTFQEQKGGITENIKKPRKITGNTSVDKKNVVLPEQKKIVTIDKSSKNVLTEKINRSNDISDEMDVEISEVPSSVEEQGYNLNFSSTSIPPDNINTGDAFKMDLEGNSSTSNDYAANIFQFGLSTRVDANSQSSSFPFTF